jgi:hypothetical protein
MTGPQDDRRARILARLTALLPTLKITLSSGVIPAENFVHNRNELPAGKVPGIILLDADEVKDPRALQQQAPGRQLPPGCQVMRMTPEIYVVLDVRKGAKQNENVGEDVGLARAAIVSAVLLDQTLQDICGSNGEIMYDGLVSDLARNRTMQGQLGLSFTFVYPLFAKALASA